MGNHVERAPNAAPQPEPAQPQRQPEPAQQMGPGLRRMTELLRGSDPDATQAAHILRDYPDERAQLLQALHQAAGNGFASRVLGIEREASERLRPAVSGAGVGVSVGNWQVGVAPVGSTDDRYDNHQNRERAEQRDENAAAARRAGEVAPESPVMNLIRPARPQLTPAPEVDAAIAQAREQMNPTPAVPMEIDPVTLLPVIPGLHRRKPGLGF